MLPRILGSSSGAAAETLGGGLLRSILAASSSCSNSHSRATTTHAWSSFNQILPLQGNPQCLGERAMSTEVSPTQKQQQLFAEMQSVRSMLLLRDPNFWHTEPYFWAHGAHLLPTEERSRHPHFTFSQAAGSPTGPELASIIKAQASNAMQQYPHREGWQGLGRHRQLQNQEGEGGSFSFPGWNPTPEPLEMKNLIKVWRRLKMKKHKIRKRQKANRYKNT